MKGEVIVLNQQYMPLGHCSIEKAICLVILGKAINLLSSGKTIKSISTEIDIPEVIVLPDCKYVRRNQAPFSRRAVYSRDNYTCRKCGETNRYNLTLDHYIPKIRWDEISKRKNLDYGLNSWQNLHVLCKKCNQKKSHYLVEEIGWFMSAPEAPPADLFIDWEKIFSLSNDSLTQGMK